MTAFEGILNEDLCGNDVIFLLVLVKEELVCLTVEFLDRSKGTLGWAPQGCPRIWSGFLGFSKSLSVLGSSWSLVWSGQRALSSEGWACPRPCSSPEGLSLTPHSCLLLWLLRTWGAQEVSSAVRKWMAEGCCTHGLGRRGCSLVLDRLRLLSSRVYKFST